jgi:Protein of unknown function (DUF3501)
MAGKLTLDDITDLRAYERERDEFRRQVIELKKRRRVHVGPIITLVFENRDTIRFQIQEMARVEKIISDEGIETELRVYNPLIPEPAHLAATMFIELTSEEQLREWLPKLVGVEHRVAFHLGEGDAPTVVRCIVDPEHERMLTRDEVTASVHYVHFAFTPDEIDRFAASPVTLVVDHPNYAHEVELGEATRRELLNDLRGE